jgi:biopolymer transport protein ExbB
MFVTVNRGLGRLLVWILAVAGAAPSMAAEWWNDDWSYRKEVTLDLTPTGANITTAVTDAPVLVRLSLANFSYFGDTKPDASDFRFIAGDGKTPLKFHVERYDPQLQMGFFWVRLPQLSGASKTDKFFIFYGNPKASPAADAGGTYDKDQALVYHFGAAAGAAQDATAYKNEPKTFGAEVVAASLIGAGAKFSGSASIGIPASGPLQLMPSKGYTLSTWVRIAALQTRAYVAALEGAGGQLVLGLDGAKVFAQIGTAGSSPTTVTQSGDSLSLNDWHHLALRVGEGKLTLFIDGVSAGETAATVPAISGTLTIGAAAANANFFTGEVDELQVSAVARSDAWLQAAARSQGVVAPLVVYGGDAQKEGGGESYFTSTLRNVTVDGWVIIGILIVLFIWSVIIMVGKAIFLGRVSQGNAKFLAAFHKMRDDPTAVEKLTDTKASGESPFDEGDAPRVLPSHELFGISTIYQLYHDGIREVMTRTEGQAAGADRARKISPAAIESIRATMDASMTRLSQKLSAQMVILTIAISGGPFLGLLGTVVGVMITFAAIAATGDVNINAIAPGTAAALVATVAGLGVAIPCLFGYNWLNSRIKEIGADMRVFVDEFVSRIAETYT